jgi:hypothetical protein
MAHQNAAIFFPFRSWNNPACCCHRLKSTATPSNPTKQSQQNHIAIDSDHEAKVENLSWKLHSLNPAEDDDGDHLIIGLDFGTTYSGYNTTTYSIAAPTTAESRPLTFLSLQSCLRFHNETRPSLYDHRLAWSKREKSTKNTHFIEVWCRRQVVQLGL